MSTTPHLNPHVKNWIEPHFKDDYAKTYEASKECLTALHDGNADPDIAAMETLFSPPVVSFQGLRTQKGMGKSDIHGSVVDFDNMLLDLSENKITKWMDEIAAIIDRKSGAFATMFPNGKSPFNSGKQDDKMTAVSQLLTRVTANPALNAVKVDMIAWNTPAVALANTKSTQKNTVGAVTTQEKIAIDLVATVMFTIYLKLMLKFQTTPSMVEHFFPFVYFHHEATATSSTGVAGVANVVTIWVRPWEVGQMIKLDNPGTEALQYFLTDVRGKEIAGAGQIVPAGGTITVDVTTLGAAGCKHLSVLDQSHSHSGHYKVELL